MDISRNSLYAQMQSMALEAGGHRTLAMKQRMIEADSMDTRAISPINHSSGQFGNILKDALNSVNSLQMEAGEQRKAFELGDRNVSLAQTMISAQKAGLAFDATVQVRNKFIEAYKEIMSMPI